VSCGQETPAGQREGGDERDDVLSDQPEEVVHALGSEKFRDLGVDGPERRSHAPSQGRL
jgi:hypothetical protein